MGEDGGSGAKGGGLMGKKVGSESLGVRVVWRGVKYTGEGAKQGKIKFRNGPLAASVVSSPEGPL
jgi:hypothetical protein